MLRCGRWSPTWRCPSSRRPHSPRHRRSPKRRWRSSPPPGWREADEGFRVFTREERELLAGHQSTNWDRTGLAADLNVAYPIDRLEELAGEGVIGTVAPRHLSFTGPIMELSTLRLDRGPAAAQLLLEDGVDVVLLTPV